MTRPTQTAEGRRAIYEEQKRIRRDREKTGATDAKKSQDQQQAYKQNKDAHRKGVGKWVRSAKGKSFYRKLARFNARDGSPLTDPGQDMEKMIAGLDRGNDSGEAMKALRKMVRGTGK